MLDASLRPVKDRLLRPLADTPPMRAHPMLISTAGLAFSLGAAVAAWRGAVAVSVVLWLIGRFADGLDGLAARSTGQSSDFGGLIDIVFDTIGYAAVPIGLAFGIGGDRIWIVTALLLGSFYVNAVSWAFLSALLEKIGRGARANGQPTSASLPRGLIEGTETIVLFTVALAAPSIAAVVWSVMAAAVTITALERLRWARHELTDRTETA